MLAILKQTSNYPGFFQVFCKKNRESEGIDFCLRSPKSHKPQFFFFNVSPKLPVSLLFSFENVQK